MPRTSIALAAAVLEPPARRLRCFRPERAEWRPAPGGEGARDGAGRARRCADHRQARDRRHDRHAVGRRSAGDGQLEPARRLRQRVDRPPQGLQRVRLLPARQLRPVHRPSAVSGRWSRSGNIQGKIRVVRSLPSRTRRRSSSSRHGPQRQVPGARLSPQPRPPGSSTYFSPESTKSPSRRWRRATTFSSTLAAPTRWVSRRRQALAAPSSPSPSPGVRPPTRTSRSTATSRPARRPDPLDKTRQIYHSAQGLAGFRHAFNKDVTLGAGVEYLQSLVAVNAGAAGNVYDSRLNIDALFASKISGGLSLGVGFHAAYDHYPLPGKHDLDTQSTLTPFHLLLQRISRRRLRRPARARPALLSAPTTSAHRRHLARGPRASAPCRDRAACPDDRAARGPGAQPVTHAARRRRRADFCGGRGHARRALRAITRRGSARAERARPRSSA